MPSPADEARRWKKELQLAKKRERDWFTDAEKIVARYRGEEKKRNRFNVLWSNTEILRPAIYNSRPNPDVRRRFRDADPLGKAVSNVLERALMVLVDGDETDDALKNDVLDGLLPGRGVSRIRYVPTIVENAPARAKTDPDGDDDVSEDGASPNATDDVEPDEELESEYVCFEHVDWRDFRHGYGRVWPEVPWVAYRHKLTRSDAEKKFGDEALREVKFTSPESDDKKNPEEVGETQKVAEFWEIWDKLGNRVFFTQDAVEALLFPLANTKGEPPLDLPGYFPTPRPLLIVENTGSLLPIPMFRLYEQQADELDRISGRIDKIVNGLRLRAVYDSKLPELADLLAKDDNEMTPIQNAAAWRDCGLDKAISWMPIDMAAAVLKELYAARSEQKAIIDEIIGISDIVRGATDPNETLGAQELKSNYHSVRLQRMQKEVQRYARDLLRLAAAAMSQKFSPQTFQKMTELNFPTAQMKQAAAMQFQQMQQMPPQPGAPPPQPPVILQMPTWEDVIGVMRSEKSQQYRIDIETDSTISGTLSSDMAGLSQVLTAVHETVAGLEPMVLNGSIPIDAAKELVMTVIRRARMGSAVEDAFDKMQPPKPPPDPNAGKAQAAVAQSQAKAQADIEVAKIKADLEAHVAQVEQQAQAQQNAQEQALEAQRTAQKQQFEAMEAKLDAAVKIIVAQIGAKNAVDVATISAADREATQDL